MQPGGQVRRLADHLLLLGSSVADEVADHDKPGGDADAHLQGNAGGGLELRHRLDQRKPGPDGAFGVMLVGLGIAEIGQYPVAHVPGDETAGSGDEIGAAAVVRADDLAHVLGVEPGRERGRADEVAEHDRELTALGGVQRGAAGAAAATATAGALFSMVSRSAIGAQQLAAMPEQDAQLLQILIRQIGKDAEIDPVVAKRLRVLLQTDPAEPTVDVQVQSPGLLSAAVFEKDCNSSAPTALAVLRLTINSTFVDC